LKNIGRDRGNTKSGWVLWLSIPSWLAKDYAYSMLISWLRAEVFYTQLAGQELCLLHVDRPAEGYGSSHSIDQPRTVPPPTHTDKLN